MNGKRVSSAEKPTANLSKSAERVGIISTSDRSAFRSCRRKWDWGSHMRQGLAPKAQKHPLWFGSGMHHCLEDYHGHKLYATHAEAVDDYFQSTIKHYGRENLPETLEDDRVLMNSMLTHYTDVFLTKRGRDPFKTYVISGEPQVEVPFELEIPVAPSLLKASGYSRVVYRGLLDRVTVDDDGYLWINDYKNVTQYTRPEQLEMDPQIDAYLLAASYIYRRPVLGFIYTQLRKVAVQEPRILKSGLLSTAKDQNTTHAAYREALVRMYGETSWPADNLECLNFLATAEESESDKFIRRDRVTRDPDHLQQSAKNILMEVDEMLSPTLPVYPNPSFMCHMTCSFVQPCMESTRGEDVSYTLETDYMSRDYKERNDWRAHLKVGLKEDKPAITVGSHEIKSPKKNKGKKK